MVKARGKDEQSLFMMEILVVKMMMIMMIVMIMIMMVMMVH